MKVIGKAYHRGHRKDVDVVVHDSLPYTIASSVFPQGMECDALAHLIRHTLPGYITGLMSLAQQNVAERDRMIAHRTAGRPSEQRA